MRGRQAKKIMTVVAVTGISLCLFLSGAVATLWSPEQAVHVNGNKIENLTLIIGTHLIHMSALTEELYSIAQRSAEDSMQNQMYYKSEPAGGTWFDIISASGLEDISTSGTPVAVEETNGLYLEYHTKSDGVTYGLRTKEPVNIPNIRDPYDLEAMEELQLIKLQYDILEEKDGLEEDEEWCRDKLTDLFRTDTSEESVTVADEKTGNSDVYSGEDTEELDQMLEKLQNYLNVPNQYQAGGSEKEEVSAVMASVDASWRLIIYQIVYDLTYQLMKTHTGTNGKLPEGYQVEAEPTDAANESLGNLNDAIIEMEGKVRAGGDTVLSIETYRWSNQLVEDAKADSMAVCGGDVEKLLTLKNITDGTIEKQQAESNLLEENLLSSTASRYQGGLGGGENSEYLTAKVGNAASVMLSPTIGNYGNKVNTFRNELEFLVDVRCMRVDNATVQEYIRNCIEEASGYYGGMLADGFYGDCKTPLDGYLRWLNNKLASLVQGGGGTETGALNAEEEDLQVQHMAVLDKDNLEKAPELEKKIAAADGRIKALDSAQVAECAGLEAEIEALKEEMETATANGGQGQEALVKQLAGKQAQTAEIKSKMSGESAGTQAVKIRQDVMSAVTKSPGEVELDQVGNAIDILGGVLDPDYRSVLPQLTQLYSQMTRERDLNGSGDYDELIGKTEEMILNNKTAYNAAMADHTTGDEMAAVATDFFGVEEDGWTEEQNAAFLAAGEMYLENALRMGGGSGSGGQDDAGTGGQGSVGTGNDGQSGSNGQGRTGGGSQGGTGDGSGNDGEGSKTGDQSGTGDGTGGQSDGTRTGDGTGIGGKGEGETGGDTGDGTGGETSGGSGIGDQDETGTGSGSDSWGGTADSGSGSGSSGGSGTGNIGIGNGTLTSELKEIVSVLDVRATNDYLGGNPFVFLKLPDPPTRYPPVLVPGNYPKMRYIWNVPKNQATPVPGSRYYEFTLFSDRVKTGRSGAEEITIIRTPKIKSVLYVPEDFTSGEFGCGAIYLADSDYAVLCSDELRAQAEELFEIPVEGGG